MPGPGFYNAALCMGVVGRYLIRTQPYTAAFNEVLFIGIPISVLFGRTP